MKTLSAIYARIIPTQLHSSIELYSNAKNVVNTAIIALTASIAFIIVYYFLNNTFVSLILFVSLFIYLFAFLLFIWTANIPLYREIFIINLYLELTIITYTQHGLSSPTAFWLIIAPIMGLFLGSIRSSVIWMCLVTFTYIAFYILGVFTHYLFTPMINLNLLVFLSLVGFLWTIFSLSCFFAIGKTQAFNEFKQAALRENNLNKQLITLSRQAGMADVATHILHNIGNILTSVSVSMTVLKNQLEHTKLLKGFIEINHQLKDHSDDLFHYLTQDPKGKNFINYLSLLEQAIQTESTLASQELQSLETHIHQIKDVVATQQTFSSVLGMVEPISLSEQIDSVLLMIGFDSSFYVEKSYLIQTSLLMDKTKLLQILSNLIRNAKDALIASKEKEKILKVQTDFINSHAIRIRIIDNGIGILSKNLSRIFTFGFTTKETGHGFGLHHSAILAKEMGGSLQADSKGLNKGAIFTLQLPCVLHQSIDAPTRAQIIRT